MLNRRNILALPIILGTSCATFGSAFAQDAPLEVVATFSILADLTERVAGDAANVTSLVGPNGDSHVYRPTPADARKLADADILVSNGLGFEGWLERLEQSSGFNGVEVLVTAGIEELEADAHDDHGDEHDDHDHDKEKHADADKHDDHDHDEEKHGDHGHDDHGHDEHDHDNEKHAEHADEGHSDDGHAGHDHGDSGVDPHAWHSVQNARVYVTNIADALKAAAPEQADAIAARAKALDEELVALDVEIKALMENVPAERRTVITSHEAFGYFGASYKLTFLAPQGVSTDAQPSASEVADLIRQLREVDGAAVFLERSADERLIRRIADETSAKIGGTLYPEALSEADGPAPTYIDMMRHNAQLIAEALSD